VPPAGYFQNIQSVLKKYEILLWDDEVIYGFGRLRNHLKYSTRRLNLIL